MKRALSQAGERGGKLLIPEYFCEKMGITVGNYVRYTRCNDELSCSKADSADGKIYKVSTSTGTGLWVNIPSEWINYNGLKLPCKVDIDINYGVLYINTVEG